MGRTVAGQAGSDGGDGWTRGAACVSGWAVLREGLRTAWVAMFNYSAAEQRQCGEDLNRWLAEGKLRANIDRTLPLAEAAVAHRLQEENTIHGAGTLAGKIILKL